MSSINSNYLILPQKYCQSSQTPSAPVFHGGVESNPLPAQATQPSQLSYPPDTVEISPANKIKKPKKKISTGAIVSGALAVVGGLATIAICLKKKKINEIEKLYSEKFALQQLAEHIDFKEAKTVEEGIKFAKEVLKIGEVDSNFTLDAINFANRGIVKVSNANKGKLFIPKKMHYVNEGDKYFAAVIQDIKAKDFGELYINSEMFNEQRLDKYITQSLKDMGFIKTSSTGKVTNGTNKVVENVSENADRLKFTVNFDDKIKTLVKKYKNNPQNLTICEKQDLLNSFNNAEDIVDMISSRSPLSSVKRNIKAFQEHGIEVNVEDFAKLSTKEQKAKLKQYLLELQKKSGGLIVDAPFVSAESTIYHEMGHLQDFAKNSKKLDNSKLKIGKSEISKSRERWGGLTYKGFKENFEKHPKIFKKIFPDLYEFLTNQEYQQTAGKVSEYAQTGIGEFIAETYAKMVRGDKIPNDVMKLYEKYNGPKLGG